MVVFSVGIFKFYGYGLVVALGAIMALVAANIICKQKNIKKGTVSWFALLAVPFCLLFARLGYCLARFGWFTQKGVGWFFNFAGGGFMFYGALVGGILAAALTAVINKISFTKIIDCLAAPAALMIAVCRLGEGLADEGWGWDLESWFSQDSGMSFFSSGKNPLSFAFFPLAHYREKWESWHWAVYVLEAICALIICLWLLKTYTAKKGDKGLSLILVYAITQILWESMRQDSVLRWGFVRVAQVLSALVIIGIQLLWSLRVWRKRNFWLVKKGILTLVCFAVIVFMEFAVEKRISFIEKLPVAGCYLIMLFACIGLMACILPLKNTGKKAIAQGAKTKPASQ